MSQSTGVLNPEMEQKIKEIIDEKKNSQGCLIPILHEIQELYGYIPYEVQKYVAEQLEVPMSDVYGVVTFYSRFTTNPTGKYKVSVCMGTACYVKGADKVLDRVKEILNVEAGETSADLMYTVEATRCIGACGLAPVMTVNEDVYGKLLPGEVDEILNKYK